MNGEATRAGSDPRGFRGRRFATIALLAAIALTGGCSIRNIALSQVGDALASSGSTFGWCQRNHVTAPRQLKLWIDDLIPYWPSWVWIYSCIYCPLILYLNFVIESPQQFTYIVVSFVLLLAPFIAAIQVIVYEGAILVLFVFVLMLLNIPREIVETEPRPVQRWLGGAAVFLFTNLLVSLLSSRGASGVAPLGGGAAASGEIAPVARALYVEYLLPFEALSVLLLAALVGAFALVEKEKRA